MAIALKSVWQNPKFQLAFKAVLFGLGLAYSPWLGVLIACWFYFRPFLYNPFALFRLLVVFLILAVVTAGGWLAVTALSILFYLILGLKNLIFIERRYWRLILSFSLFYLVFLNFFLIDQSSWFGLKWLGFLLLVWLLIRDCHTLVIARSRATKQSLVSSAVLTLLAGEVMWIISWLPIGFLNSANLAVLFMLLLFDLTVNHFWGTLRKKLILRDFLLFLGLLIVILGTSKWIL